MLQFVLTFSTLVRKQLPDDSPEAEDLDLVIQETRRCAGIIRRLLDFAREKAPEKSYGDLNELIRRTTELVSQSAQSEGIEIGIDLDESLPAVWMDENLVGQVIMNMLVNAEHAIEGGGRIQIRTAQRDGYRGSASGGEPVAMAEIQLQMKKMWQ